MIWNPRYDTLISFMTSFCGRKWNVWYADPWVLHPLYIVAPPPPHTHTHKLLGHISKRFIGNPRFYILLTLSATAWILSKVIRILSIVFVQFSSLTELTRR